MFYKQTDKIWHTRFHLTVKWMQSRETFWHLFHLRLFRIMNVRRNLLLFEIKDNNNNTTPVIQFLTLLFPYHSPRPVHVVARIAMVTHVLFSHWLAYSQWRYLLSSKHAVHHSLWPMSFICMYLDTLPPNGSRLAAAGGLEVPMTWEIARVRGESCRCTDVPAAVCSSLVHIRLSNKWCIQKNAS